MVERHTFLRDGRVWCFRDRWAIEVPVSRIVGRLRPSHHGPALRSPRRSTQPQPLPRNRAPPARASLARRHPDVAPPGRLLVRVSHGEIHRAARR
jgi:hypothetical protein